MRVVWISAGLLIAFIVALVVVYEPESGQPQLSASENPEIINPFVEDESSSSAGVVAKEVDLVQLPDDAGNGEGVELQASTASNQPTQSVELSASETTITENLATEIAAVTTLDNASENREGANLTTSVDTLVVAAQKEPAKEEKKLGLAMIAFEKEKNKEKIAVIVHESNTQQLTEKEIKALYLDRLTRWQDGSKVMLFDLPLGDKHRDKFSKSILQMTALEADHQESKRRELRIKANDVEVKAKNVVVSYVEQNPNAVAYVPLNLVREKSNVKVVLTIP